eukprot:5587151-Pleurochrysis_carterae.AAC.1
MAVADPKHFRMDTVRGAGAKLDRTSHGQPPVPARIMMDQDGAAWRAVRIGVGSRKSTPYEHVIVSSVVTGGLSFCSFRHAPFAQSSRSDESLHVLLEYL